MKFDEPVDFFAVAKRLIIQGRIKLILVILLIIAAPLSVVALVAGRMTFGWVFMSICLVSVLLLVIQNMMPDTACHPGIWRFKLASAEEFLTRINTLSDMVPLPGNAGYAVLYYGGMTIYLFEQGFTEVKKLSSERKRLYKMIPDDFKPPKLVEIQNNMIQLVLIVAEKDANAELPPVIQRNAQQLLNRNVPMVKMAVDKATGTLYIPSIGKEDDIAEVRAYYNATKFMLDAIEGSQGGSAA
ncbi:MAG: hypothetical protein J5824_05780 [Lachnospiraceae bacterium]|nr:hypothetical protein [Lachnospiraceae bacterium]